MNKFLELVATEMRACEAQEGNTRPEASPAHLLAASLSKEEASMTALNKGLR